MDRAKRRIQTAKVKRKRRLSPEALERKATIRAHCYNRLYVWLNRGLVIDYDKEVREYIDWYNDYMFPDEGKKRYYPSYSKRQYWLDWYGIDEAVRFYSIRDKEAFLSEYNDYFDNGKFVDFEGVA
jgi:hypothetical protein